MIMNINARWTSNVVRMEPLGNFKILTNMSIGKKSLWMPSRIRDVFLSFYSIVLHEPYC